MWLPRSKGHIIILHTCCFFCKHLQYIIITATHNNEIICWITQLALLAGQKVIFGLIAILRVINLVSVATPRLSQSCRILPSESEIPLLRVSCSSYLWIVNKQHCLFMSATSLSRSLQYRWNMPLRLGLGHSQWLQCHRVYRVFFFQLCLVRMDQ